MPQCKRCEKYFPPQFLVQMLTMPDDPEALQCIYCSENITEITLDKGRKYTKEQCIKDYEIFLKKLKEKKNIADVLQKGKVEQSIITFK